MRIRLYIAAAYAIAAIVASGFADASPIRAYDESIGGQLETEIAGGVVLADVIRTDVEARIRDNVAEVHLRQIFASIGAEAVGATYLLPLGSGAEVIAIEVAEGTRVERKSVGTRSAPVQAWPRMYSQALRLEGGSTVEVTLIYRQPVLRREDVHSIALPIATIPGGIFSNAVLELESDQPEFADLPEYLGDAMTTPAPLTPGQVNLRVFIEHDSFAGIHSDTHAIDVTAVAGARVIELAPSVPVANRTFVLDYVPVHPATTLMAHADRSQ